jgi:hypothetical protein
MPSNSLPEPKTVAGLFMLLVAGFAAMWLITKNQAVPGLIGCSKKVTLIIF